MRRSSTSFHVCVMSIHQVCMTFRHLFPLGPEYGSEMLRQAKITFLNSYCHLAYWQSSFWSNLWLPAANTEREEEQKKGLTVGLRSAPFKLFTMLLAVKDLKELKRIEETGQVSLDDSNCDMELVAKTQLSIVDKLLNRLSRSTIAQDLARLDDKSLPTSTKLALRVTISDRQLLLKLRHEICRDFGVENPREGEIWNKFCEGCGTFRDVKRCTHCGVSYYCSRRCQRLTWKYHKLYRPAKETASEVATIAAGVNSIQVHEEPQNGL